MTLENIVFICVIGFVGFLLVYMITESAQCFYLEDLNQRLLELEIWRDNLEEEDVHSAPEVRD